MGSRDMLTIEDLEYQAETAHAICVRVEDDERDIWLPKSQIEWDGEAERGDVIAVDMPEWLAEQEGLF